MQNLSSAGAYMVPVLVVPIAGGAVRTPMTEDNAGVEQGNDQNK